MSLPLPPPPAAPLGDPAADEDRWAGWRRRLSAGQGWLADSARFAGSLVTLNARKSVYRWAHGRRPCPCQVPSDSGRAGETGCDPVAAWHQPARFQRVCPLLQPRSDGVWKCSVDAGAVRPFWGRAGAYLGGAAVVLYLVATLSVFGFLRGVGYPVRYRSVAWPGAWHEIREARARYFYAVAAAQLRANNAVGASMALFQSYNLDPRNYAAGRLLAELWQPGGSDILNRLYRQLMADHPELRSATAQAWFQALLEHGDFPTIEALALDRLPAEPGQTAAWLNVLLVASRRAADPGAVKRALDLADALPPWVGEVCRWELALRNATPAEAHRQLLAMAPATSYAQYYVIDRLLAGGFADDALWHLEHAGALLASRDRAQLALATYGALGWRVVLAGQVQHLLEAGVSGPLIEMLSAQLIRTPDAVVLAETQSALARQPLPADARVSAYAALFCAAGASGDAVRTKALAETLRELTNSRLVVLDDVAAWLLGDQAGMPAERYLPALPALAPEVDYALFDFSDRRRRAVQAASATAKPTISAP